MKRDLITSAIGIVVLTLVLGILYPLVITGVGQVAFPGNANGQQVKVNGKLVGSKIVGQNFADQVVKRGKPQVDKNGNPVTNPDPKYFQGRPSATVPPNNAAATAFSNLGPNNTATEQAIAANIQSYIALEKPYVPSLSAATIPVDAVDTSGSGIDPDISTANADIQAHRVASVRKLSLSQVDQMISTYTHGRGLGFSGEPGVNVLELNLALDRLSAGGQAPTPPAAPHERQAVSLFRRDIVRRALIDSLVKLDPRVQIRNPVMFVVEIGAVITTITWLIQVFGGGPLGGGHEPSW